MTAAANSGAVAYLVSRYPSVSHTFILREVQGLRALGLRVEVASVNAPDRLPERMTDGEREEAAATYGIKRHGVRGALAAFGWAAATRPIALLRTLREALAQGRGVKRIYALAYAVEEKPRTLIDFATLTGAARVALGPELPAMFANDEKLAAKLLAASEAVEDPLWRMPLWRGYRRLFDSDIADFNNSGKGGFGGAIVAALFLEWFVPDTLAWAHFDTFAWNDISRPGRPAGGEAMGLRAALAALE